MNVFNVILVSSQRSCFFLCVQDDATTERDYLKEELGMFMEEIKRLEEEKATLSKEKEEKREMDEFVSLEEEFRKEHEVSGRCRGRRTTLRSASYLFSVDLTERASK